MHELAIAESIVDIVIKAKVDQHLDGIRAVGVRIGALTDVVPEALEFGFEAIIKDTDLEGCDLKIERIPPRGDCLTCERQIEVEDFIFICPHCGSRDLNITQGQELEIAFIEVDDGEESSDDTSDGDSPEGSG